MKSKREEILKKLKGNNLLSDDSFEKYNELLDEIEDALSKEEEEIKNLNMRIGFLESL